MQRRPNTPVGASTLREALSRLVGASELEVAGAVVLDLWPTEWRKLARPAA